jgi:hypothetical protein
MSARSTSVPVTSAYRMLEIDRHAPIQDLQALMATTLHIPCEEQCVIRMTASSIEVMDDAAASALTVHDWHLNSGDILLVERLHALVASEGPGLATTTESADEEVCSAPDAATTGENVLAQLPAAPVVVTKRDRSVLVRLFEDAKCQLTISFNLPVDPAVVSVGMVVPDFNRSLRVSRIKTLAHLRTLLAEHVRLPLDGFKIKRSQVGAEIKDGSATLQQLDLIDGSVVFVERGRPMQPDEVLIKLFLYDADKDKKPFSLICELPVRKTVKIDALKQQIVAVRVHGCDWLLWLCESCLFIVSAHPLSACSYESTYSALCGRCRVEQSWSAACAAP